MTLACDQQRLTSSTKDKYWICVWACRPSLKQNNHAADTVKARWCVHEGKVTTTFCMSCCHLLTNDNVQTCCIHSNVSMLLQQSGSCGLCRNMFTSKSFHSHQRGSHLDPQSQKYHTHIAATSTEPNIKQPFNSNYLM